MPFLQLSDHDAKRWLPVRNDSGSQIPAFGLAIVTDLAEYANELIYVVTTNDVASRHPTGGLKTLLANGPTPIAAGGYGAMTCDWPTWVAYSGTAPLKHHLCGVDQSTYTLTNSKAGFVALDDGASSRVLVVPCPTQLRGKTTAAHAKTASGTIDIWTGSSGGAITSPLVTVTAWNDFAALEASKYVLVVWEGTEWMLGAGECGP